MFIKLGNTYKISLLVTDVNNSRITNDSPYTIIHNLNRNVYWNGISWVNSEFRIYLEHVINGVYQYLFTPDETGLYEIVARSDEYQVSKTETAEVFNEDFASYQWLVGNEFTIKYPVEDTSLQPVVKICREEDKTYWDGTRWIIDPTELQMDILESSVSTYTFTPELEGKYYITIFDGQNDLLMVLQATSVSDTVAPVVVNHTSMKSQDGTNCVLTTESGTPLPGVKISVYDSSNSLVTETASDTNGGWSLLLKPAKYYFVFEKDGYASVGFTRTVR